MWTGGPMSHCSWHCAPITQKPTSMARCHPSCQGDEEGSDPAPSQTPHLETRAYFVQLQQLDHPDPAQHSWFCVCHTWTGWRATRRSVVCFASFCLIKNLDSWNPLLVRRVFNQTGVHCIRAWCYNKRCTNQWTIQQFRFGIFHHCLHKQS